MDQNTAIIDDFEDLLKKHSSKKPPALYSNSENIKETLNCPKNCKLYSSREVLANVAKQVKAIQNADTASHKYANSKLDRYKKGEFLTVDRIPVHTEVPPNVLTKFETQCVTDTQLINVIENAEIIDRNRGITQEFDETFCQKSDEDDSNVKLNNASLKTDKKTDFIRGFCVSMKENDINDNDSKLFENSGFVTCEMDTITYCQSDIVIDNDEENANISKDTEGFNRCAEIYKSTDTNRSTSPVLTTNRRKSTQPLVVDLYTFENFENLAHPVIEEHEDFQIAKNLINSQIIGREICIPDHFYENIDRESPVFGKIECITTNINKEDYKSLYTCTSIHIDEDVKNDDTINEDRCFSATNDIISENKKPESGVIISDMKDEILFSSDEEYEYLHRDVQELPLTCALETSFYDTSDVLDKTMYVGFQTASNKSIQIHTDSFYKAKSILNDIDNESTETTLTDLVKIFDSGKAMSENVLSNLKHDSIIYDINNTTSAAIEHKDDTNLPTASENSIDQEQKIDDTFENACLTELEQDGNLNDDDIVMSQVIEFKSLPRSTKLNNTRKEKVKKTDVVLTALEHIQMNDDVPLSQIIEFKSITRTPKYIEDVCNTGVNSVFTRPADVTKRKFEGFKTASNKKIKFSDKALARCKNVFQDIDLNDNEGINCKSVTEATDDGINGELKLSVPGVSHGGLKTSNELSNCKKDSKNDVADVISVLSHTAESEMDRETNVRKRKFKMDDMDLQMNDQILREFEDNDMPFEETNNNDCIGFKTANMTINEENDYDITATSDDIEKSQITSHKPTVKVRKVTGNKIKLSGKPLVGVHILKQVEKPNNREYDINNDFSEQVEEKNKDNNKFLDKEFLINTVGGEKIYTDVEKKNSNHVENEFNCGIDTQDFFGVELTRIEDFFKENETKSEKLESATFIGFQTASKKAIVISEKAMENSKKLFEDITNKESDSKFQINDAESKQTYSITDRIETIKSNSTNVGNNGIKTQFKGLVENMSTKTNIEKPEKNTDAPNFKDIDTDVRKFVGFQTASAKPIHISAAAIEKTKIMLSEFEREGEISIDHEQSLNPKTSTSTFGGFQTASNKQIKISTKALAKSKQLMNDFELHNDFDKVDNDTPFKHIDDLSNNPRLPSTSKFIGFQTASNKEVKISNDASAKRKKIFQDDGIIDKSEIVSEHLEKKSNQFKGFHTASNRKVSISEKALEKSREIFQENDNKAEKQGSTPLFRGFQTASNKEVQISKEALAKSRKIFQDVDIFENESDLIVDKIEQNKKLDEFKGFQRASNKKVILSDNALEKSRKLFHDIPTDELKDIPVYRGFQTASNKPVKISDEALARSKNIFQDVDISEKECESVSETAKQKETEKVFTGFQTASNQKVNISEKALEKSRKFFNDIDTNDFKDGNNDDTLVFRGFQTASNKAVKISDEALARSKIFFQDIDIFEKDYETASENAQQIETKNVFRGFQTASNKKVNIPEKALEKSRNLFDGIDYNGSKDSEPECAVFQGFQTASNKKVKISVNALAKSKKLFEDLNLSQLDRNPITTVDSNNILKPRVENKFQNLHTDIKKHTKGHEQTLVKTKEMLRDFKETTFSEVNIRNNANVTLKRSEKNLIIESIDSKIDDKIEKDVINTQVLNDFQETLNTEDFCKSTPKSKRSGSPILSCPKAKKRKFEAPYRCHKNIEPKTVFVPPKLVKTFNFNDEYKKHKKYTLQDIENLENEQHNNKTAVEPYIFEFNYDTLLNFQFSKTRNEYTKGKIDTDELKKIFLGSVNKKIVPDGWLDNHIKLIIWKLLSYEIKYPSVMKNTCTVRNVLEQLKYRYDRELYHVQRPILRKVLEKDEVPSKTMVLCVAGIYVENISVTSVNPSQNVEVLLTDGWYCVKACTDRMLVRLLSKRAIVVGTKIVVCGAELINCEQGIAPWEDTSSVRLKLSGNSVRPCPWHTRLGLRPGLIQCPLGAVRVDGGRVSAVRVLIARVYPPLYVEKMEDGSTVTLSERLEHIRLTKHESEREAVMEKLYEEVEKEMSDQDSQDSESCSNDRGFLESGSQISRFMKRSADPDEYRSNLTKSQNRMLEEHSSKQREKLIERVRAKFQQKLEKNGLITERNVVPLLKVRVAGFGKTEGVEVTKGYLSIWRPSAAVLELLTEGAWIEILNIIPTGIRNSEVQLSAGRQTVFNPYKQTNDKCNLYANTLRRKCYEIKEITQNPALTTDYNEIDTVGMIFCIEPSTKEFDEKQSFQNVYLADADKNIICVNFWGGLKKFGFENVLDTGQIITCVNLQKRAGNTRKSIPQYRVTELSYFTKTPKDKKALEITNDLSNKISKIKDKFCQDCMLLKNNYSVFKTRNNENVSPYRFDYNVSRNVVSPLQKCDLNLNLTGLDFESSFDSQEISPQMLLRKKKINEKIEKIRLNYGEPPPLASIHIINKSKNASATYKSPLISNSECPKNDSAVTPRLQNVASSMSINRTYVRNVNPVKLDFSSASHLNESVDHFAEEFEASPPLSLDSDVVN